MRAFHRWAEFAVEKSRLRSKAKRSVQMLLKKGMVCCFYEWQAYVKTKKETTQRLQHAAKKVLGKWMFGGLSRSFECWAQHTSESKRLKSKAKVVIYRIKNACAAKCMSQWIEHVRKMKRAKRSIQMLLKKGMV